MTAAPPAPGDDPDAAQTTPVAALTWREVTIAGSSPPVKLAPLGGGASLVRFPAGWRRPAAGHYDVAEEAVFFAGGLTMGERSFGAGEYHWFPAGFTREASSSPQGAVAFAWFEGRGQWFEAPAAAAADAERDHVAARWDEVAPVAIPSLGLAGRPLRVTPLRATYVVDAVPDGLTVPASVAAVDLFELSTYAVARASTGERLAACPVGPVLVRLTSAAPASR